MANLDAWKRYKQIQERARTIVAELRAVGRDELHGEAADVIEHLQNRVTSLNNDRNEEIREGQRAARDAYAQGQWDEHDRSRDR